MESSKTSTWYSGDWKPVNNNVPPYNGVAIEATANYSPETSPPTTRVLVSVDITVIDYTYNPKGVASSLTLYKADFTYYIPVPLNDLVSPPEPDAQFTITNIEGKGPGQLSLESNSGVRYLSVQFSFGDSHVSNKREEIGYIMKFATTYPEDGIVVRVEL